MQPFRTLRGKVAPLLRNNIDTDQIIPKQFLKRIERTGFGEFLFFDWSRNADGSPDKTFPLNASRYRGAQILVAGDNFGCGSSREHAVWALEDFGFRAVLAPSFADIFAGNCLQSGILALQLEESVVAQIANRAEHVSDYEFFIDLERCLIGDNQGLEKEFQIEQPVRHRLLNGLDSIGLSLEHESDITLYERRRGINHA